MSGQQLTFLRSSVSKFRVGRSKISKTNRLIVASAAPPRNIHDTSNPTFDHISALFGNGTHTGRVDSLAARTVRHRNFLQKTRRRILTVAVPFRTSCTEGLASIGKSTARPTRDNPFSAIGCVPLVSRGANCIKSSAARRSPGFASTDQNERA